MAYTALMVLVVMGIIGVTFGFILAYANKKFAVEINPLIHIVEDVLPKGQCGACGYAGCLAYAEAVVLNEEVPPNLCTPGKAAVAKLVAELTGKVAKEMEPRVAHIRCAGDIELADRKYYYIGIEDCAAASLLHGGPKGCQYGCIGFGTCSKKCPFGAITLGENGLPIINHLLCTGCGVCEKVCPKHCIDLIPLDNTVQVNCNSHDKGAVARQFCKTACIGCSLCQKNCPHGAINMDSSLAVVDHSICKEKCSEATCIAKCPTKAIKTLIPA